MCDLLFVRISITRLQRNSWKLSFDLVWLQPVALAFELATSRCKPDCAAEWAILRVHAGPSQSPGLDCDWYPMHETLTEPLKV